MTRRWKLSLLVGLALGAGFGGRTALAQDVGQTSPAEEDFSNVGARAAEFLTIPVGARGTALGSAFAAAADDITAIYWNPAGLGFMEGPQAFYTYVNMPLDVTLNYGAVAAPVFGGQGVVGAFFEVLDLPSQEITTVLQPEGTDSFFDSNSLSGGIAYAHNISDRFSAGVTAKIVSESIADVDGSAIAFDFGSNYHTTLFGRTVKLAFVVQNIGSEIQLDGSRLFFNVNPDELDDRENTESPLVKLPDNLFPRRDRGVTQRAGSFTLPTIFKTGLSYNVIEEGGNNLTLAGEFWNPNNQQDVFSLGAEYRLDLPLTGGGTEGAEGRTASISLRGGWFFQQDEFDLEGASGNDEGASKGLSLGGGLEYDFGGFDAGIDYAYRDLGRLTQNHLFSVNVGL
ncbi:MAG TPA: PorV/PorQ family protein [Gemmatimonadota bacterium]|jgi:hypothetical protein